MRRINILLGLAALSGCGTSNDQSADHTTARNPDSGAAGMPMHGMPSRAAGSGAMIEAMRTHMRTMQAVSADSIRAGMPMHREMMTSMLAEMTKDMSEMKMPANARWSALMDSVRQDMSNMLGMDANAMAAAMSAHHQRLTRLMDMHQHEMMQRKAPPK
jgi:hypothetical protein